MDYVCINQMNWNRFYMRMRQFGEQLSENYSSQRIVYCPLPIPLSPRNEDEGQWYWVEIELALLWFCDVKQKEQILGWPPMMK